MSYKQINKLISSTIDLEQDLNDLIEGISWNTGTLNKNEKNIDFWLGKRSQSGKKVPKRFNKNLKFYD